MGLRCVETLLRLVECVRATGCILRERRIVAFCYGDLRWSLSRKTKLEERVCFFFFFFLSRAWWKSIMKQTCTFSFVVDVLKSVEYEKGILIVLLFWTTQTTLICLTFPKVLNALQFKIILGLFHASRSSFYYLLFYCPRFLSSVVCLAFPFFSSLC